MTTKPYYEIEIFKPLYETIEGYTVGIWNKRVSDAIRFRQMMLIGTKGIAKMFYPKWIKKNCPTISKIYLRPNEPMIEYKVFIPKPKKKTSEERLEEFARAGSFA